MRQKLDRAKLMEFMRCIGEEAAGPGKVYLTGGASMLLWGVREQTLDVDIRLDPEPLGVFEAIAHLKNKLDLNVELASPADFLPAPLDWREKSPLIDAFGSVTFYHYDPRMQALSKLERGLAQDLSDCAALLDRGLIKPRDLRDVFERIRPSLIRYPAVAAETLDRKVNKFMGKYEHGR